MMPDAQTRGFTLIELSIVLVIIGLIVGGVMVGQTLIRASELRSVMRDIEKYQTAVYTFRNKYNGLPGDLDNATQYWGTGTGCPARACTATDGQATCNGNANGKIATYENGLADYYELQLFWQHLSNAGLIEGVYSGVSGCGANTEMNFGSNAPASRISKGGYTAQWRENAENVGWGIGNYYPGPYLNVIYFGAAYPNDVPVNPILSPEDALTIDQKMDDGKPGLGRIVSFMQGSVFNPNCTTSATAATAQYDVTATGVQCSLMFRQAF